METIQSTTTPDMNEIVRIYAKEKGLSETAAWALIRGTFVPKSEVLNIIESQTRMGQQGQGNQQPSRIAELFAQRTDSSMEKMKLDMEIKKLDMQEKAEAREQRKIELEEAKLANNKEMEEAKIAFTKEIELKKLEFEREKHQSEEKWRQAKEDSENKWRQAKEDSEDKWRRSKEEFDQKVLLVQSGKKPDEAGEMIKNQEKFYERILDERTRHTEEVGDLKEDSEKKLKDIKTDMDSRFEKFIKDYQNKPASDDFINKMKEYKKMQTEFLDMTFDTLEARGFDKKQLEEMRKVTSDKAKEQEGSIGRLWEVGKEVWKQIEPRILPPEQTPAQAMEQQRQIAEQQRLAREREDKLRKDVELEASRLTAENNLLEQEKVQLKQMEETNRALQQKYYEQRDILVRKAMDIGIPVSDEMNNEQIFMAIEQRDAEIEREHTAARAWHAREKQEKQEQAADAIAHAEQIAEQTAEKIEPVEPEPQDVSSDEIEAAPEAPEKEAPGRKKKKTKSSKDKVKYTIYTQDGTELARVESNNHKNAGLKVANTLNGTLDNPVRIKVSSESGEEKEYDAYSAMIENKAGTTYAVPKVKVAVV